MVTTRRVWVVVFVFALLGSCGGISADNEPPDSATSLQTGEKRRRQRLTSIQEIRA